MFASDSLQKSRAPAPMKREGIAIIHVQSVIIVQCNGELGRKQQRSVSHNALARVIAPQDGVARLLLLHLHHVDVCGLENLSVGALPDHRLKTMDNICL